MIITGRPISKKNSKRLIRAGGRIIPISSKAYMKFEKDALGQLLAHKKTKYKGMVHVDYVFFIKGRYHVDLDNLIAGINDILEKSGIIENDDNIVSITARKKGGSGGWSTKIEIREEE